MSKNTVCVDFDGVLNNYTGWKGESELYTPRAGAKEFMDELRKDYHVVVFTTRNNNLVQEWLEEYDISYDDITSNKVGAVCYIDDRGLKFNGDFNDTLNELNCFKAHWEPVEHYCRDCEYFSGSMLLFYYNGESRAMCLKTRYKYVYPGDKACIDFKEYTPLRDIIKGFINKLMGRY